MAIAQIEHVNITVSELDRSSALLQELGGWHERWRGPSMAGGETIHVGTDDAYISLYTNPSVRGGFSKGVPMNHIGILVENLDAAEAIVQKHGLKTWGHDDYDPGRRFYFFDWDGIEFEVVSYE